MSRKLPAVPEIVVLETAHEGYESCLDTLEEQLVRTLEPMVAGEDLFGSLAEFNKIRKIHDALAALRALAKWADACDGALQ